MNKKITTNQLIQLLAAREELQDLSKRQIKTLLQTVSDEIVNQVSQGNSVTWINFCTITSIIEPGRYIPNLNTGEQMWREEVLRPKFIASDNFKEKLKNKQ